MRVRVNTTMKTQDRSRSLFPNVSWKYLTLLSTPAILFAASNESFASTDYGPAVWRPVCSGKWYTSGYGKRFFVIHDMEGYYLSSIAYLQRCDVGASVHYAVNGKKDSASDAPAGQVSQLVRDAYYAWHARCWNQYSMGTEHEGFASHPAWFTEALYQASGDLTGAKCNKYNMPKDRNHVIGHGQENISSWRTWASNQGYSSSWITCNSHTDRGPYWNWSHYMDIVQGKPSKPNRPTQPKTTVVSWSKIDLKWTDNSDNENGFEIQKSGNSNTGPWTGIHNNGENDKSYTVTGLSGNNKYWFRVRSYNGAGNSDWSNVTSATTDNRYPPNAPSNLTAVANNDDKITLNWTDNAGNEDGFKIFRSIDGTDFSRIDTIGVDRQSYVDTGLRGNRKYWYKVVAYNDAGDAASNKASDTTPPTAPDGLSATKVDWNSIKLKWNDNSGAEVGFKIERAPDSGGNPGTWTQIATNIASDPTYTDSGLAGSTKYWYRVRGYNSFGNSAYSNTDSATTANEPPTITTIGNRSVVAGTELKFRVASTDPNKTTATDPFAGFQSFSAPSTDGTVMFRSPSYSSVTDQYIDGSVTNYTKVVTTQPSGNGSTKAMKVQWTFKTGTSNYWLRLPTANTANLPNPVISLNQSVRFQIYSTKSIKVGIAIRETTNNPSIGQDGGTDGPIEYVGVTNLIGASTPACTRTVNANTWTTLTFNCQKDPALGTPDSSDPTDGIIKTGKGVFQSLQLVGNGGTGAYTVYLDDFEVYTNNTLDFTLEYWNGSAWASASSIGAKIYQYSGDFVWTPTTAQAGNWKFRVHATDQLGLEDTDTFTVTVSSAGNSPPALNAIGDKTVKENNPLTFTATAADVDVGQTKTFSLGVGAPAGASIDPFTGVFTWTPSESQGGTTNPITVIVTDNGSPTASDSETINVTVEDLNSAPTLASISTQTVNENQLLTVTPSASDSDLPAQTLVYSLLVAPQGMTINTNTGVVTWTPTESDGPDTNQVTIRVTDNGSPKLFAERTFSVVITEGNLAPVLTIPSLSSTLATIADFENYEDGTYNGTVMFRQPSYSGTTSGFLDPAQPDLITVSTNPPGENGSAVLAASWGFKTGTTNPWIRLTTYSMISNTYSLPNPTIDLTKHVKFDIYSDKAVKVALGVRETGTSAPLGDDGGIIGTLEWVGATGSTGGMPLATRTIAANTWTTLDFDLPNESIAAFTGDGVLAGGKGVLDHIAIMPNGGMGLYNVYLDNFEILTSSTSSNITVSTGEEISIACVATDADRPAQTLTFSLDPGAPTNAFINEAGVFTWTPMPDQSPSTNVITIRVTDDGSPALSDAKTVTIKVKKVNTAPSLEAPGDYVIEQNSSATISFTADATDDDIPADTLSYSLVGTIPPGAVIDPVTGVFNWTPPTSTLTTTFITIRVTDNGVPSLYTEQQFSVSIVPVNTAPSLTLGTARITEPVVNFETFTNNTPNGNVMFRSPSFSTSTTNFIDLTVTNYAKVTNSFPAGNSRTGGKVLVAKWNFKTGVSNYWVRLTTTNCVSLPNSTIDLGARVKFDIYSTKSLKVGLGVRETGTSAEIGANGGTTGAIEWVGVPAKNGTSPNPSRVVNANTWTTLEFDLPTEAVTNFSGGNSVLATDKGVLEHLALVGNGGTGAYTVYVDNFEVVNTLSLTNLVTMKSGSELSFTASATDPNPGAGLSYGLEADFIETHPTATIDPTNGLFSWTPVSTDIGTTNIVTVFAEDSPTNNAVTKSDSKTFSVTVVSDALAPQGASEFVAGGDMVEVAWDSVAGKTYAVQSRNGESSWATVQTVVATGTSTSIQIQNDGADSQIRVVEVSENSSNE